MITYTEPGGPVVVAIDVLKQRTEIPPELTKSSPRHGMPARSWAMAWPVGGATVWIGVARTEASAERAAANLYDRMWAIVRKMPPSIREQFEALLGVV